MTTTATVIALGLEPGFRVSVLDGFALTCDGVDIRLQPATRRVVGCLALLRRVSRAYLAALLWLDTPDDRAGANLRSSLWRLRRLGGQPVIDVDGDFVGLADGIAVDLWEADRCARALLAGREPTLPAAEAIRMLSVDVLPHWWDDWLVDERERHRQRRLHALEHLGAWLRDQGRHGLALEAGLAAVSADPLRESAQRLVVSIHLAEGNPAEALAQFRRCAQVLGDELGLRPSAAMEALVARALAHR